MKTTLNRSVGMASILLLAGIGMSACSGSDSNSNPNGTNSSQTATPDISLSEAIKNKTNHTPVEISSVVDSFFLTLDKESRDGQETVRSMTDENRETVIKQVYPKTLAFFSKDMDEKQIEQMIVMFSSFSMTQGKLSVTLPEEVVVLSGDTATVPGKKLAMTRDGEDIPKTAGAEDTAGVLHLSYNESGKWDISGFDLGTPAG